MLAPYPDRRAVNIARARMAVFLLAHRCVFIHLAHNPANDGGGSSGGGGGEETAWQCGLCALMLSDGVPYLVP